MVGAKSAALFASRMSNERSADELRPRKMERVNGVAPSSQPWHGRILLFSALHQGPELRQHRLGDIEPHPLEMESRVRVALTCEVLRTTAWAARPTGLSNGEWGMQDAECWGQTCRC